MAIYVAINGNQYPAIITGKMADKDWDNRASKAIKLEMTYSEALETFINEVEWSIVQENEILVENIDEENNITTEVKVEREVHDNSEYCIAGEITDHRDGTITVKMGKPTAEELLAVLIGG
jgi:hypothetical protein